MSGTRNEQVRLRNRYGPYAIVTGASSGIGLGIARRLAEAGLNLVLVARREELLEASARTFRSEFGTDVRIIAADLSSEPENARVLAETRELDIGMLVASAGFGTSGAFLDSPVTDELDMLHVNCRSLLTLTHHFGRRFRERGRGGLVLLSSMVAFQGVPYAAHYAATKAYVQSLAEGLHVELSGTGVDVLAAAPGPTNSGFADRADMRMGMALASEDVALPTLRALGRKSTVMPGLLTKFLVGSLATLPRVGKVRMMGQVMHGMTKHQNTREADTAVGS